MPFEDPVTTATLFASFISLSLSDIPDVLSLIFWDRKLLLLCAYIECNDTTIPTKAISRKRVAVESPPFMAARMSICRHVSHVPRQDHGYEQ
jgi:hypothetical protein